MGNGFTHQNSFLYLCVDCVENGHISGRVFSQRLTQPMGFSDLGSLFLQVDHLMDQQGFPQAFQDIRSFVSEHSFTPELPAAATPQQGMPIGEVLEARGARDTLVLSIVTRQNATWQGRIHRLDCGNATQFSSALELLAYLERELNTRAK